MRYNKIRKMDISNGPGVRVSVFMQGCTFHCPNCFNPETHDFNGGKEFTNEVIEKILDLCTPDYIAGLSILGGEPLHPRNRAGTAKLAKAFKKRFPQKNIWVWTGYLFDRDLKDAEALSYIDVLVDGQFVEALHDFRLEWRGSSNQRVIDVPASLQQQQVVLIPTEDAGQRSEK